MQKTPIYVYHIPNPSYPEEISEGYIGVSNNPKSRFYSHSNSDYIVGKAIRKYDIKDSCIRILGEFDTRDLANLFEKFLRPKEKIGWNIAPGGQGGFSGAITSKKRQEMSEKMTGELNPYHGKKHSKDIREKISKSLIEKGSDWNRNNASNAGKGNLGIKKSNTDKMKEAAMLRPKYKCPYCKKIGQYNSMIAYHGDNCKVKT